MVPILLLILDPLGRLLKDYYQFIALYGRNLGGTPTVTPKAGGGGPPRPPGAAPMAGTGSFVTCAPGGGGRDGAQGATLGGGTLGGAPGGNTSASLGARAFVPPPLANVGAGLMGGPPPPPGRGGASLMGGGTPVANLPFRTMSGEYIKIIWARLARKAAGSGRGGSNAAATVRSLWRLYFRSEAALVRPQQFVQIFTDIPFGISRAEMHQAAGRLSDSKISLDMVLASLGFGVILLTFVFVGVLTGNLSSV